MSTTSELGHLTMPTNFLALRENPDGTGEFQSAASYALPLRHTGWAMNERGKCDTTQGSNSILSNRNRVSMPTTTWGENSPPRRTTELLMAKKNINAIRILTVSNDQT